MGTSANPTVSDWSTTPIDNATAGDVNFSEGQPPNTVNDSSRQLMADVRAWYEDAEWRDFGDTPTRTGGTTFTVPGDQTSVYKIGRRIRCTDSSTLYGTITNSAYTTLTTVTVSLDSGSLSVSLTAVAVGFDLANDPIGLIESGSKMLFQQTTAPAGWTKDTTHNNKALRIVSGTVGTGGSTTFTAALNSAVSTTSNGAHTHTGTTNGDGSTGGVDAYGSNQFSSPTHTHTFTTASDGGHTHTTNLDVQYVDFIIATKD